MKVDTVDLNVKTSVIITFTNIHLLGQLTSLYVASEL